VTPSATVAVVAAPSVPVSTSPAGLTAANLEQNNATTQYAGTAMVGMPGQCHSAVVTSFLPLLTSSTLTEGDPTACGPTIGAQVSDPQYIRGDERAVHSHHMT
jgi:hypothetical protein